MQNILTPLSGGDLGAAPNAGFPAVPQPENSQDPPPIPPGMILREAGPDDTIGLLRLGRELLSETDHFVRRPEERAADLSDMRRIVDYYAVTPGWTMINVWDGTEAVAEGVLSVGGLARTAHVGTLGIGILRRHWGRGLGRRMMADLERRAAEYGVERLEFTVLAHNRRARDFYRRLGYSEDGRRVRSVRYAPDSPSEPVRYGDEIALSKWIGPADCITIGD